MTTWLGLFDKILNDWAVLIKAIILLAGCALVIGTFVVCTVLALLTWAPTPLDSRAGVVASVISAGMGGMGGITGLILAQKGRGPRS